MSSSVSCGVAHGPFAHASANCALRLERVWMVVSHEAGSTRFTSRGWLMHCGSQIVMNAASCAGVPSKAAQLC